MMGPEGENLDSPLTGNSIQVRASKTCAGGEGGGKKGRFYKPLPTQFRHNGFDYRQIVREGNAALYEQKWTGCFIPSVCYEVVRIRRRAGFYIGDRFIEAAEIYPNSEAWGTDGFTITDKDAALPKLRKLGWRPGIF
jgi:hypothetical protein